MRRNTLQLLRPTIYNHRVKLGFNDTDRAAIAVKQASGKRLTYRQAH
jgi:hypothetical protein